MKRLTGWIAGSVVAVALMGAAQATPILFTAALNGTNQNPANGSTATGAAWVWIDSAANMMTVKVVFSGLTGGPATAAHIHCCIAPPGNVGVATAVPTFPGFPNATSGSYMQTFDMTNAASYNPGFIAANGGTTASAEAALFAGIMDDMAYLNIHDAEFPGGEIRGFLTPAPEPATLSLLGIGLLGAFAARGKRKA
jgi:hypothetical protein